MAAAALLGITALFVLGHSWVVALIMTGVIYRVAKTDLVKRWSGNAFNLLLVYLVISIASGLVFGAVDLAMSSGRYSSEATLGEKVGDWIRYVTAIVFAVSAVAAYRHRYFRYPTLLHPLRS
ncbi:hypothetical protein [Kocuria tytonis]|uniref:Uncharacterized protein n=1 Tax=Kocuria tytonis TaxID=2054280 RepID=A0A495ABA8_9MICC|nr:hypothetical protein [Kocuria tytonis]RKQ36780.1 hypothetical protein C1C97_003955 [Kocuria tytonis]